MTKEWGCTPDEYREHDVETVLLHLEMMNAEARVRSFEEMKGTGKP